jgi:hypothetical protein
MRSSQRQSRGICLGYPLETDSIDIGELLHVTTKILRQLIRRGDALGVGRTSYPSVPTVTEIDPIAMP